MFGAPVTTYNDIHRELQSYILEFCTPKENVHVNSLVCKSWKDMAYAIAKIQLIAPFQKDIQEKAANFLKMVPQKLEFYCASYAKIDDMRIDSSTPTNVCWEILEAVETYTVCMACFFRVDPTSNISEENKEHALGRVFVELHQPLTKDEDFRWRLLQLNHQKCYFPIDLFSLTATGDERVIEGDKDNGSVYFVLQGKLIKLIVEAGSEEARNMRFFLSRRELRDRAVDVVVSNAQAQSFCVREDQLYLAPLDALPLPQSIDQTASNN